MIYIPDSEIERFLLEDIAYGDLTTRSLGIHEQIGEIQFISRQVSVASGIRVAQRLCHMLDLELIESVKDGEALTAGQLILQARGPANALHQAWKVTQNILEWSCGVACVTSLLVNEARQVNPQVQIACTRKSIPGTRLLATTAVLAGGGILHRAGTAETLLVFANHRNFLARPLDWEATVSQLRQQAPEKKIILEANNLEEAYTAMEAQADIVQLDKFTPSQIQQCSAYSAQSNFSGKLIAAGGISLANIKEYAATGVPVLVTSSPYYAKPADIQVRLRPL